MARRRRPVTRSGVLAACFGGVALDLALLQHARHDAVDLATFGLNEALDRLGEPGIAQIVHAARHLRVEAPQPLELAAGAGLEAFQARGDAVLDRRVVTHVEVQEADLVMRAPVAAVQRTVLLDVEGPGDEIARVPRGDEAEVVTEARP